MYTYNSQVTKTQRIQHNNCGDLILCVVYHVNCMYLFLWSINFLMLSYMTCQYLMLINKSAFNNYISFVFQYLNMFTLAICTSDRKFILKWILKLFYRFFFCFVKFLEASYKPKECVQRAMLTKLLNNISYF